MQKTRTFIAVECSPAVCNRACDAIDKLAQHASNVKWVTPELMHWTLQFLGDITDQELAEVCRRVQQVALGFEPFSLTCHGVGAFPSTAKPKTLWLGASSGSSELCALQGAIEESLSDLGFRGELRRYTPHLTLGRVGRNSGPATALSGPLERLAEFDGGEMLVEGVTVVASRLRREGPEYAVLATAPLGK